MADTELPAAASTVAVDTSDVHGLASGLQNSSDLSLEDIARFLEGKLADSKYDASTIAFINAIISSFRANAAAAAASENERRKGMEEALVQLNKAGVLEDSELAALNNKSASQAHQPAASAAAATSPEGSVAVAEGQNPVAAAVSGAVQTPEGAAQINAAVAGDAPDTIAIESSSKHVSNAPQPKTPADILAELQAARQPGAGAVKGAA